MRYILTELAQKQKVLDKYIKGKIEINDDQYWEDRIIALSIELAEVSNEIRYFKFWSKKGPSTKEVILDELVDCIHFALSLSNTLGIDELKFIMDDMKRPIRVIYFDILEKLTIARTNKDKVEFKSLIFNILEIAWYMNYSMEDIQKAYDIKNKVNFERQDSGY